MRINYKCNTHKNKRNISTIIKSEYFLLNFHLRALKYWKWRKLAPNYQFERVKYTRKIKLHIIWICSGWVRLFSLLACKTKLEYESEGKWKSDWNFHGLSRNRTRDLSLPWRIPNSRHCRPPKVSLSYFNFKMLSSSYVWKRQKYTIDIRLLQ